MANDNKKSKLLLIIGCSAAAVAVIAVAIVLVVVINSSATILGVKYKVNETTSISVSASDLTEKDWKAMNKLKNLKEINMDGSKINDYDTFKSNVTALKQKVDFDTISLKNSNLTNEQLYGIWSNVSDSDILWEMEFDGKTYMSNVKEIDAFRLVAENKDYTYIEDISDIRYFYALEKLDLSNNPIADLSPLANMKSVKNLILFNVEVSDITPLAGLTNLIDLNLYGNDVKDISALASLKTWKN